MSAPRFGEIAAKAFHAIKAHEVGGEPPDWSRLSVADKQAWEASAHCVLTTFLSATMGGAVTFEPVDSRPVRSEVHGEPSGEALVCYASLRESIVRELDCPASPAFASELADLSGQLIRFVDDLLGVGRD